MGIQGLYQSTLDLIKAFTAFGLEQSAVRDISEANGLGNIVQIGRTVAIIKEASLVYRIAWTNCYINVIFYSE